jgi:hypothetical protein
MVSPNKTFKTSYINKNIQISKEYFKPIHQKANGAWTWTDLKTPPHEKMYPEEELYPVEPKLRPAALVVVVLEMNMTGEKAAA